MVNEKFVKDSADAILLIDGNVFVDCNEAAVHMLGYKGKDEMLHIHLSVLSPEFQPDGRRSDEKADEMIATAFRDGNNRFEWIHKRVGGEVFPVEVLLTAIPLGERRVLYTVWRDITERKRNEEALCSSEARFRSLIEQSPLSTMVFSPDGTPILVNRAYEELFGISLQQLEGWNILKDDQLKELGIGKPYSMPKKRPSAPTTPKATSSRA